MQQTRCRINDVTLFSVNLVDMWDVITAILCALIAIYWYNKRHFSKWKRLGIPGPEPSFIFGNMKDALLMKKPVTEAYADIYKAYKDERYVGIYLMRRPGILLKDLDIMRDVLVKEFNSFHDNDLDIDHKLDPIFGNNPFTVKGERWKSVRSLHSPHFTTSKNKMMFPIVEEIGSKLVQHLNEQIENDGGKFTMDALELVSRFTTDNVAMCSLGIEAKSFEGGEIREMNRNIFNVDFISNLKLFMLFVLPSIARYLSMRLIPTVVYERYKTLVLENLKYRKENNIVRNDFFEAIQVRKDRKATLEEMTVQVGGFFIDGFATSSSGISFMVYCVAANYDVQTKLREEIEKVKEKHGGKLSFEAIQEITYLDNIISESLRLFPPLAHLTKICTKPYTFPAASDSSKPLTIEVGTPLVIPLLGLHYDEKYYPDPYKFDPERFSAENKETIPKFAYLAFGEGPRICLGMRFATMQAKILIVKLVSNFDVRLNPKTKTQMQFDPVGFLLAAIGGLGIDIYKRNDL